MELTISSGRIYQAFIINVLNLGTGLLLTKVSCWEPYTMMTDTGNKPPERRKKLRFPIQRELRYKLLEDGTVIATGFGQTLNMASGGMAFTAERQLKPGGLVELSISWPVLLDESCPMRLIVFGRLLRSSSGTAACTVDKYEFRTQSRAGQPVPIMRTDSMLQRWADAVRKDSIKAQAQA